MSEMSLFKEKMTVALALDRQTLVPGETVVASVRVAGSDDKVRAVRVELAYDNTYWHSESRSSSEGGGWENTCSRETVTVASEELSVDDDGSGAVEGTCDIDLELPVGSPASAKGWVDWGVSAILDRRRGLDRQEKVPITVLAPPNLGAGWAKEEQVVDPGCDMFLELPARVARVGATLAGVLHVKPKDRFSAKAVRVELEGSMRHEDNIVRQLGLEKVALAGSTEFLPGVVQQFPFQIAVPADAVPSLRARHNEMRWHVKGVCDRSLRGDRRVAAEVVVYNTSQ